jgi:hypothetical protein
MQTPGSQRRMHTCMTGWAKAFLIRTSVSRWLDMTTGKAVCCSCAAALPRLHSTYHQLRPRYQAGPPPCCLHTQHDAFMLVGTPTTPMHTGYITSSMGGRRGTPNPLGQDQEGLCCAYCTAMAAARQTSCLRAADSLPPAWVSNAAPTGTGHHALLPCCTLPTMGQHVQDARGTWLT